MSPYSGLRDLAFFSRKCQRDLVVRHGRPPVFLVSAILEVCDLAEAQMKRVEDKSKAPATMQEWIADKKVNQLIFKKSLMQLV